MRTESKIMNQKDQVQPLDICLMDNRLTDYLIRLSSETSISYLKHRKQSYKKTQITNITSHTNSQA